MSLEEMIEAESLPATEALPQGAAPDRLPLLTVESKDAPDLEVRTERLPDGYGEDLWSVDVVSSGTPVQPGMPSSRLERVSISELNADGTDTSDGYRPPWLEGQFFPRLAPHATLAPGVVEQLSKEWPWCTIGALWFGWGGQHPYSSGGTGVMVGRDLVLTASHCVPWNAPAPWWMAFAPAYREPAKGKNGVDPRFGLSRIVAARGAIVGMDVNGFDCAICRLALPLGDRCGWMGSRSFGDEDDYYDRTWMSVGYPQSFARRNGQRPAVRFEIGVRDIDSEGQALEIETVNFASYGWSGGPLWGFIDGKTRVIGIASGLENDDLDPQRSVFAGGKHMVDLVKSPPS
jgi:hypothetical protein